MAASEYSFSDSLEELQSRLVWRVSFVLIGFGIAATWFLLISRDIPFAVCSVPFLLVILGRSLQILVSRDDHRARLLLVWGITSILIIAMLVFDNPWLPFLGIPCVFLSAMLVSNGGIVNAALLVGVVMLCDLTRFRQYPLFEFTITLGLAVGSSWLSAYTLFTAVHWYSAMQTRSQELLEATRDHRAELRRTLKSLQISYETQQHIQL
jgi:hypothetical protein